MRSGLRVRASFIAIAFLCLTSAGVVGQQKKPIAHDVYDS